MNIARNNKITGSFFSAEARLCLLILLAGVMVVELFSWLGFIEGLKFYSKEFVSKRLFTGIALSFSIMWIFSVSCRKQLGFVFAFTLLFVLGVHWESLVSILFDKEYEFTISAWVWSLVVVAILAFGGSSLFLTICQSFFARFPDDRSKARGMLAGFSIIFLYTIASRELLKLTWILHPLTLDMHAYLFDLSLGVVFYAYAVGLLDTFPILNEMCTFAYRYLPAGIAMLYGLYIRGGKTLPINVLSAIILSGVFVIAMVYHLVPVSGPLYALGETYAIDLPTVAEALERSLLPVEVSPRNGVPSMHFGFALLMWLISFNYGLIIRAFFSLVMILNVIATIGFGEHYLVDLVISFPYILFIYALCRKPLREGDVYRRRAMFYGVGATLAWVFYLRFGVNYFDFIPGLSWLLALATIYTSYRMFLRIDISRENTQVEYATRHKSSFSFSRWGALYNVKDWFGRHLWARDSYAREAERRWPVDLARIMTPSQSKSQFNMATLIVCLIFFSSGFAALVYQILFSKVLSYSFGSTSVATYTVLSTYMGGMAIGAWLGGKIALTKSPLKVYALIEIVIAAYCFFTPTFFHWVQSFYVHAGSVWFQFGQIQLELLRFLLGVLVLLLPTILMGMTLPVLIAYFKSKDNTYGQSIAILYSANTFGAALGALISGYFIIPALGVKSTIYFAVWLNMLAASIAYIYADRSKAEGESSVFNFEKDIQITGDMSATGISRLAISGGYLSLFIIGFISLALEVIYVHMLSIVAGNSVYAFALMVFTFLLGLGAGSTVSKPLMLKIRETGYLIALLASALAFSILTGMFFWEEIPDYFGSYGGYPVVLPFASREFIRGLVCFMFMFPPAFIIGILYPVCLQYVSETTTGIKIPAISSAIALNTVGNILGVLVFGFIFLPNFGVLTASLLLAILACLISLYFLYLLTLNQRAVLLSLMIIVAMIGVSLPSQFDYSRLANGANVYFQNSNVGEVIDHLESLDGGLTTVHIGENFEGNPVKTLLTNGKFQGNDSGEIYAQIGFTTAPLLHFLQRENALVIGYGTGTSANVLHKIGFEEIDVVDISEDIFVLANRHFNHINDRVTEHENVQQYVSDGKNFLLLSDKSYDLISMEISSIWFASAASLYSKDFYALAKKNMKPDGVLQQWAQLHHITPFDLAYIIGTIRLEFQYVWFYLIGGQGILVATNSIDNQPIYREELASSDIDIGGIATIKDVITDEKLNQLLLTPEAIDKLIASFLATYGHYPVSDYDNNILEYSTPKGNVLDSGLSYTKNVEWLRSFMKEPHNEDKKVL